MVFIWIAVGVVSLRTASTCHKLFQLAPSYVASLCYLVFNSSTLVPPITKLNRMCDADFSAECRKGRRQLCHLKPTLVQKYPGYWMEWSNYLHFIMKRQHQNQINIVVTYFNYSLSGFYDRHQNSHSNNFASPPSSEVVQTAHSWRSDWPAITEKNWQKMNRKSGENFSCHMCLEVTLWC